MGSSVFVSEDAEAPEYLKQSVGFGDPCGCALAARFVHQVLEHQNAARLEQLRGLLRERFGFAAHWEKRDLAGYAPVVGHNGPKMKQSAESEMEAPESSGPTRLDENLFPVIPPGYPPKGIVTFRNGDTLFNTGARHASMDILAVELSRYLKQPHRRRDGASCEVRFRPILDARFVCCCAYCRRWVGGNRHVPSHPSTGATETRPQAGKAEISDRRASRGSHGQSPDRELSRVTIGGGIASTKRQHRTRQAREGQRT